MTIEEAQIVIGNIPIKPEVLGDYYSIPEYQEAKTMAIEALERELKNEMTVEEYRQRMIQAFHNADCDELIALVAMPTEKEFEELEWLLKTHYKVNS